jgi:Rod binding domain-containing protein
MSMVDTTVAATAAQARDAYAAGRQSGLAGVRKDMSRDEIKAAAEDFEAFFLGQMLQPMFNTVDTDALFGGGPGEDMWKGMMVDQYAKEIAHTGGVGIADDVMKAMIQAQEADQ